MLELKNISYSVKGGSRTKILDQISLAIKPNTLAVITGPNGSGKSTLAEIIMGIKTPTAGQVFYNNQDITKKTITERAGLGLAFSFQQPVKFKGLNAYDLINIASGELISKKEAGQYLWQVGLAPEEYLLREVNSKLSGGELKRIEIATILARKNAELIIFDEPEAGIDLWSFNSLIKVFEKMHSTLGGSIIIISHQERILNIADQIIVVSAGNIKSIGTKDEILPDLLGKADRGCKAFAAAEV